MGTLRFLGTFLADPVNVPVGVIAYLASQLSIADPECIVGYAERVQTQQDHAQEIREHSGYKEFADRCGGFALMRFLYARIWVGTERPSVLFDLATAWLLDKKVLLPGVTTLTRLISTVRERVAERLWQRLSATVSPEQRTDLEDTLILTGLDKVEEPESLQLLRHSVARRQPLVDLPELLLEIQARTGFASEFSHISEARSRLDDLPTSICAVLLAEACNVGLTPMARKGIPALERDRLLYVQQDYIRPDTLSRANARLVDYQATISLAQAWGGGEVASADGLRFIVPLRTLNAGPNPKYFGTGRGITLVNYTSDQFSGFKNIVVTGTLRDSLVVLEGLLNQETGLHPKELMTDTASYSDMIFGLFHVLGYQFSPRLADVGEARFWRIDTSADYGVLNGLARQTIHHNLIKENWDDVLRVAGSLKLGTVNVTELLRALQGNGHPSTLAKAIAELGRIAKSLYLLSYIDDPAYRRRILIQLNKCASRHSLARATYFGQKGEVRQQHRDGQEEQLGALGVVVDAMVLWDTLYMNRALEEMRGRGMKIVPEDVERLSPLGYEHINLLGRYTFSLSDEIRQGAFHPLRELEETEQEQEAIEYERTGMQR